MTPEFYVADFGISAILVSLAVSAALFIVAELLKPDPSFEDARAAGLGDFNFPTATESRQIPVVWGTALVKAPNVIWFGDLFANEIKQGIKRGLFKTGTSQVVGHQYFIGIDMAICHGPVDALRRIVVDDEDLLPFDTYADGSGDNGEVIRIDEPEFFGGSREGGGIFGDLAFYRGLPNQNPDPYLVSTLGADATPAYVDLCHAVWRRGVTLIGMLSPRLFQLGFIGESPNIRPWFFEVSRWPNGLGIPGDRHKIGEDSNPAAVIHEIWTNTVWGMGKLESTLQLSELLSIADVLHSEGQGFSLVADSGVEAREILSELLRQIDAFMYQDPATGKVRFRLLRPDFDPGTLPVFNESNILEVVSFGRSAWGQTANSVEIKYIDRAKDYQSTSARAQDMANVRIQNGEHVLAQSDYPGVKTPVLGEAIASRELRANALPLARATIITNRDASVLRPGDLIRFSWNRYGIENLVLRIGEMQLGDVKDGRITLSCIEERSTIGTALFAPPAPSNFVPVSNEAVAAVDELVTDLPAWFTLTDISQPTLQDYPVSSPQERTMSVVARPSGFTTGYQVWADTGPGGAYEAISLPAPIVPSAVLVNAYPENTDPVHAAGFAIEGVTDSDGIEPGGTAAAVSEFGSGLIIFESGEIAAFEGTSDLGGGQFQIETVHRGLLDTVPEAHSAGERVWFFTDLAAVSEPNVFGGTDVINVKHRTRTPTRVLDLAVASTLPFTFARRTERPLTAGNLQIEGQRYPTRVDADDVDVTWAHRNRRDPLILDQDDASSALGLPAGIEHRLVWRDLPALSILRQVSSTGTSYTYLRADQISDAGAEPQALRLEIFARHTSDGFAARASHVRDFETFTLAAHSLDLTSAEFLLDSTAKARGVADAWSVLAWVKRLDSAASPDTTLVAFLGAANGIRVFYSASGGEISVLARDSSNVVFKNLSWAAALPIGVWTPVVVTYDGALSGDPLSVYLNGALVAPSTTTVDTTGSMTATDRSAEANDVTSDATQVRYHSIALWDVALSAGAVADIVAGGRSFNLNYDKGAYTNRGDLQHWFRLGFDGAPDIDMGIDYALNPPSASNLMTNASGITAVDDRVLDAPA